MMKFPKAYETEIKTDGDYIVITQGDEMSAQTDMGSVSIHLTREQAKAIAKEIGRILKSGDAPAQ